jgi:hypothetical protein
MTKNQTPRVTRYTAARVLRGVPVVVPIALADLLAAAAAPPHDGELVGERTAAEVYLATIHRTRSLTSGAAR